MATETVDLGKVLITHKGDWATGTDYEALDVVNYNGSSYLCILAAVSGILVTNTTYWRPLSKSAYEYAIEQGYEGTEEEFGVLIDSISDRELSSNKVTSLSSESTDIQYPSAKVTYEGLANKINKDGSNSAIQTLTFMGVTDADVPVELTMQYNKDDGTYNFTLPSGATGQLFQELYFHAKATEAITEGDAIQYAGAQERHALVKKAVPAEIRANPYLFMGVATTSAANNAFCKVTWFGNISGVSTTGWSLGNILYFDSANGVSGKLTNVMPTAPNTRINVGVVTLLSTGGASNGTILVRPEFHNKLVDSDDVYAPTLTDGVVLKWNSTNSRFEVFNVDTALGLKIDKSSITSELGDSEELVVSQKGVKTEVQKLQLADTQQSHSIKQIEDTLNSININQESTTTVVGYGTVLLPKNAANGGMGVKLEGLTAENLAANGDFRNGTSGWTGITGSASVIGGELYNDGTNTITKQVYQTKLINNQKYYIKYYYRVISGSVGVSAGGMPPVVSDAITGSGYFSKIYQTTTTNGNLVINFLTSSVAYVDKIQSINLTATFGAGNEPDLATCDKMFANYFEGVKSFEPTGRVRSVGKNLLTGRYIDGSRINQSTGLTTPSSPSSRIDYFKIPANKQYILEANDNSTADNRITFYDANKTFISGFVNGVNSHLVVTSPSNTVYAMVSTLTARKDTLRLSAGAIRIPYEPYTESNLYLQSPVLRSNGLVKDEIRKGANGYELVKRVGVGIIYGSEGINNGSYEAGIIGTKGGGSEISTYTLNTISPISGAQDGRLTITTAGTSGYRPQLDFIRNSNRINGQWYEISFNYKVNSGTCVISGVFNGTDVFAVTYPLTGSGRGVIRYLVTGNAALNYTTLYFDGRNLFDIQLDNISDKQINPQDGAIKNDSLFSQFGNNIHYTLAAPVITPIPYAGLLNSNSNGTVYHEPYIADAGVYDSGITIQSTNYPISEIEKIIKWEDGVEYLLDATDAIIAANRLSFTHPDLTDGDLVMFTYAYDLESTVGKMTLTHYDSRYVIADTANGKFYKQKIVATNGVATIQLEEV